MKKLVLTILALCALGSAVGVDHADAWSSARFRSPSNNIHCMYRKWNDSITCATKFPRKSVTLYTNGRTAIAHAFVPPIGPVLQYGDWWTTSNVGGFTRCDSWSTGISCSNGIGGFVIARQGIETW